ncbi:MAG: outer membrane beta-barrel protein [Sediminibacterium sp.]|nr:outer membrane beta-barrel protein [Sediminibacterium sp.]
MDYKNYQDDEFEQLLQDEVKQHRMYPSDHVWTNIRTDLHGNPSWHALTFISLLIITTLSVTTILMAPSSKERFPLMHIEQVSTTKPVEVNNKVTKTATQESYFGVIEPQNITVETITQINENQLIANYEANSSINLKPEQTLAAPEKIERIGVAEKTTLNKKADLAQLNINKLEPLNLNIVSVNEANDVINNSEKPNLLKTIPGNTEPILLEDDYLKNIVSKKTILPWKKLSKVGFQFYVTPSKSYRTLSDAEVKQIIQPLTAPSAGTQNVPMGLNYSASVNDIVRHSPATGLELGFAALYNITSSIKFKAGVQLNVRQYHIETFKTFTSNPSTISLINNNGIQTINLLSPYNNNAGYKSEQLDNRTYQVSIPIGVQWEIIKGNRMGLNAEASVQPTYSINNSTYLLSTDYKNYADGNGFMRKWNINTAAGINISYKSGSNLWQIGPQIRYQHLPSYTNQYPIKEHLMDYGIRLGITRQWK